MYNFDDLIDALKKVEAKASDVSAWHDNDGEETLNSFAFSGVGGKRSEVLVPLINEVLDVADRVLEFTRDDRLHGTQANRLEDAGFLVDSEERGYVSVYVYPTEEAFNLAEEEDEPLPDKMLLIISEDLAD